ncbi:hypothetical protein A2U01_0078140, partial [Trifolium medium]|nr:hypothetical protein [Trifolium medium]
MSATDPVLEPIAVGRLQVVGLVASW